MLSKPIQAALLGIAFTVSVFYNAGVAPAAELALPTTPTATSVYFESAFNAGDLDALTKLYDEESVFVGEPGHPA